jgi:hypothetical protein
MRSYVNYVLTDPPLKGRRPKNPNSRQWSGTRLTSSGKNHLPLPRKGHMLRRAPSRFRHPCPSSRFGQVPQDVMYFAWTISRGHIQTLRSGLQGPVMLDDLNHYWVNATCIESIMVCNLSWLDGRRKMRCCSAQIPNRMECCTEPTADLT